MEETIKNTEIMEETFDTEVIDEATELAEVDTYVEDSGNGTKVAVAAGLTTVLVGGFLIGKKLIKKHKDKKAAAEIKEEEPSLDMMLKLMEEKEAEIDELKERIESMIPQKVSNKETAKEEK